MADTNTTVYLVTDVKTVPYQGDYASVYNTTQHRDRLKAEARYHDALAKAARMENVTSAGAYMVTNEGFFIDAKVFDIGGEPAPEPEPETTEE